MMLSIIVPSGLFQRDFSEEVVQPRCGTKVAMGYKCRTCPKHKLGKLQIRREVREEGIQFREVHTALVVLPYLDNVLFSDRVYLSNSV